MVNRRRREVRAGSDRSTDGADAMAPEMLDQLQEQLAIDRDDLDSSLADQPNLYFHVADVYSRALADREKAQSELSKMKAKIDNEIRYRIAEEGVKRTEGSIEKEMKGDERYHEARAEWEDRAALAERWGALKESYQQRSFMLRELVQLYIAERHDVAGSSGAYEVRARKAEEIRSEAGRLRRVKRDERDSRNEE